MSSTPIWARARSQTMLKLDRLSVHYGGIVALNEVSIEVKRAESVLLVGSNGAGKASLINAVIGLVPAFSGRILFDGKDITGLGCPARSRLGIGYSPEGRRVFKSLTVTENILSGTIGRPMAEARANLAWIHKSFPLLKERSHQPANQLSGGEQQIVAIA